MAPKDDGHSQTARAAASPPQRGSHRPAIETLEGRALLSGDITAMLPAAGPNAVVGQTTYNFTVTYTDDTAIDVTTLGNNNLDVVGPIDGFTQQPTLVSYSATNPNSVQANYQFTAPGGAFVAADSGDYTVDALTYVPAPNAQGVADTSGNGLPDGKIGDLNIVVQPPPSAQLTSSQQPFTTDSSTYDFTVNYSDAVAIDTSTLGDNNIEVDGPNGYLQVATLEQNGLNGPNVAAIYQITAPGDTFVAGDAGVYTVNLREYSPRESGVADTSGAGVPAGPIGTLNLASPAQFPPMANFDPGYVPAAVAGQATGTFVVAYGGGTAIDTTTFGNSNIAISSPSRGFSALATYDGTLTSADPSTVQAIYQFNAPDGTFSNADDAVYDLSMLPYAPAPNASGVADANGLGILPGYIGSFDLKVQPAPPDTIPPTAAVGPAQSPIAARQPFYDFEVQYTDNVGIEVTTLSDSNLMVTGPAGFSQPAQYVGLASNNTLSNNTTSLQAIYQIQAPEKAFDASNNGAYTVSIQPYTAAIPLGVADTSGNGVPAGVIGTFNLQVPPAPYLSLSNVVYAPGTYAPGGVIALRATVTNTGNATAAPFTITAGLSSTSDFMQESIVFLTTMSVNQALAPGQSTTVTVSNAAVPAATTPGAYYFGAAIDYSAGGSTSTPSGSPSSVEPAGGGSPDSSGSSEGTYQSSTPTITVAAPTPTPTPAPIGGLNPSFGTGGIVRQYTGLTSTAAVAIQSDNKTVAVGEADAGNGMDDFGVTRFNADGSLDTTFGGTGTVVTDFGGNDQPVAVAIQSDGKILVAGTSYSATAGGGSSFVLARYNADGSLDTSFGNAGLVVTQFAGGSSDVAHALLLMSNGQVLLVGQSNAGGAAAASEFALARYNTNGSLDTSFGTGGLVLTSFLGGDDSANAVSLDPRTGKVLVAGSATDPASGATEFALARYNTNGSLDTTFGNAGKVLTPIAGDDSAFGVAVTPKGQVVAVGASFTGLAGTAQAASSNFAVVRYNTNGILDKSFGAVGIATVTFGQPALANQIQLNADGSMLVAGATAPSLAAIDPAHLEVALAELTSAGRLDPTFGTGGKTVLPLSASASAPAPSLTPISSPGSGSSPLVGTSPGSEAAAGLMLLAVQRAIAEGLGDLLVVVATEGADTVVAQVVPSSPELTESIQTTLAASVLGGSKGSAVVTLANSGNQPAVGAVTVTLYASLDNSVSPGDTVLATLAGKALKLKAHASQALKMKFTLPSALPDGNYYIVSKVNAPTSATGALSADTAAANRPVRVQAPFVNLSAPALATPAGLRPGATADVGVTLTNSGNVLAAGTVAVKLYAAAGATPAAGDPVLGTQTLKLKLKPNGFQKYVLKLSLPAGIAPGSYFLLAGLTPALSGGLSGSLADALAGTSPLVVS